MYAPSPFLPLAFLLLGLSGPKSAFSKQEKWHIWQRLEIFKTRPKITKYTSISFLFPLDYCNCDELYVTLLCVE